jgi:hypothetical protein
MSQEQKVVTSTRRPVVRAPINPIIAGLNVPQSNNQISQLRSGNMVTPAIATVPEMKQEELKQWVDGLYIYRPSEAELKEMHEAFSYKGFNREDVLKQLKVVAKDPRTATELIILCSLRGPQVASRIALTNGKSPAQLGIPASGGQGTKILTCNKITAATADLAAYYMKLLGVPKRLESELPGWLQFPAAGSIRMPERYRVLHLAFTRRFSELIGGVFQEQIYMQMEGNAYLDERLRLFDQS